MPVTFPVSPELRCTDWRTRPAWMGVRPGDTYGDQAMVTTACDKPGASFRVMQGSIAPNEYASLVPQSNGFVQAVVQAYGTHSHLRIRPDDVWIAILGQLSFYVNAHAEELREYFVSHGGQQSLYLDLTGDYGELARMFVDEMKKHVSSYSPLDPELCLNVVNLDAAEDDAQRAYFRQISDNTLSEWILPDFSTTTLKDYTVCSVLMMATCKAYFKFTGGITCGFPSVTLEGTKEDWQRLLYRTTRLYEFGDQPAVWAEMLRPILRRFVAAFDGNPDVTFWKHAVHRIEEYCGQDDLTGWITAFCVWNADGKWAAGPLPKDIPVAPSFTEPPPSPSCPSGCGFAAREVGGRFVVEAEQRLDVLPRQESGDEVATQRLSSAVHTEEAVQYPAQGGDQCTADDANATDDAQPGSGSVLERHASWDWKYTLDGVSYFTLPFERIPDGYGEVDVMIDDDGKEIPCMMVAGNLAFSVTESTPGGKLDTVSPSPQWYMLQKIKTKKAVSSLSRWYDS
ncbi:hypothetical protein ONZ51_g5702 [Trametes cubensis]|uniref:Uncharacterized protein n=1 Tax=Trametes cubensis TaxID=1111947 RepID=A0AAD7TW34_9APHY|nr:hypothetical protein ONZ51_g5702 [Trametes cubensis]